MGARRKLLFGVGINDADYPVRTKVGGKYIICPFYSRWMKVLSRCYSKKLHLVNPTYADCSICEEWFLFSSFKGWMEDQDWEGKQLDKDIIVPNNKVYSPDTCAFIDQALNKFFKNSTSTRGSYPQGVCWSRTNKKFSSQVKVSGETTCLGHYDNVSEAEIAYLSIKCKLACSYRDKHPDHRVRGGIDIRVQQMYDRILALGGKVVYDEVDILGGNNGKD